MRTRKLFRDENGSVMLMVTLALIIFIGFTALAIDGGAKYLTKAKLQNAADAAALAAAAQLPNDTLAESTAKTYASINVPGANTTPTTPYDNDNNKIEVVCKQSVQYAFAGIFGSNSGMVSARSVAKAKFNWNGEALPFLNVENDYTDPDKSDFTIWNKVSSGYFTSINDADLTEMGTSPNRYFKVNYLDGVIPKNGTVANKADVIEEMFRNSKGETVYVFSLSKEVMDQGWVEFKDGSIKTIEDINQIANNGSPLSNIKTDQIVLLECIWDDYIEQGPDSKTLELSYTGNEYSLVGNDIPQDFAGPSDSITPQLIE